MSRRQVKWLNKSTEWSARRRSVRARTCDHVAAFIFPDIRAGSTSGILVAVARLNDMGGPSRRLTSGTSGLRYYLLRDHDYLALRVSADWVASRQFSFGVGDAVQTGSIVASKVPSFSRTTLLDQRHARRSTGRTAKNFGLAAPTSAISSSRPRLRVGTQQPRYNPWRTARMAPQLAFNKPSPWHPEHRGNLSQ